MLVAQHALVMSLKFPGESQTIGYNSLLTAGISYFSY